LNFGLALVWSGQSVFFLNETGRMSLQNIHPFIVRWKVGKMYENVPILHVDVAVDR